MDFNSLSSRASASMKRKQSTSLLGSFSKPARVSAMPLAHNTFSSPPPQQTLHQPPQTATSSHFSGEIYTPSPDTPYSTSVQDASSSSRAASSSYHLPMSSGRRTSDAKASMMKDPSKDSKKGEAAMVKRPEDVFKVVKDRMFCWSYMVQWYQSDIHWLNTVKISQSTLETSLGPARVDSRSRNFLVLGASLSALFDIAVASDFLRALFKLLDEWEAFCENSGTKGMKNLFRGQGRGKKPSAGGMAEMTSNITDGESLLMNIHLPFSPDFFQVHSTTCSIIRDLYKKILGMVLPARPGTTPSASAEAGLSISFPLSSGSLFHPSTIIHSAPLDSALLTSSFGPTSPSQSISSRSYSFIGGRDESSSIPSPSLGTESRVGDHTIGELGEAVQLNSSGTSATQQDSFQALIAGELPPDRMLIGDGQQLTPTVIDLFQKVDAKLRKHFSVLLREGDTLARRVLDDELAALTMSLTHGPPMKFDVMAGLSANGNAFYGAGRGAGLEEAF